jgi:hypothetical protein
VDNLKVILIAAVIAGHAVLGYTELDAWSYADVREVTLRPAVAYVLLAISAPSALLVIPLLFLIAGLGARFRATARSGRRVVKMLIEGTSATGQGGSARGPQCPLSISARIDLRARGWGDSDELVLASTPERTTAATRSAGRPALGGVKRKGSGPGSRTTWRGLAGPAPQQSSDQRSPR